MSPVTETEKAYFAGFFDGEGYIGLAAASKTQMSLRVIIGQKTREVLDMLRASYGGGVYQTTDKRSGRSHFYWDCKSRAAERFVRDIEPYVHVKRAQVDVALEYRDRINEFGAVPYTDAIEYRERIKAINSPMGFGGKKLIASA